MFVFEDIRFFDFLCSSQVHEKKLKIFDLDHLYSKKIQD